MFTEQPNTNRWNANHSAEYYTSDAALEIELCLDKLDQRGEIEKQQWERLNTQAIRMISNAIHTPQDHTDTHNLSKDSERIAADSYTHMQQTPHRKSKSSNNTVPSSEMSTERCKQMESHRNLLGLIQKKRQLKIKHERADKAWSS